jgi:acetolactate synthase-1/2/3 large subunit
VTGRLNAFSPTSKKIHADIDPSSINKNVAVDVPIVGDAGAVLAAMIMLVALVDGLSYLSRSYMQR